jgi:hypothetical protein
MGRLQTILWLIEYGFARRYFGGEAVKITTKTLFKNSRQV